MQVHLHFALWAVFYKWQNLIRFQPGKVTFLPLRLKIGPKEGQNRWKATYFSKYLRLQFLLNPNPPFHAWRTYNSPSCQMAPSSHPISLSTTNCFPLSPRLWWPSFFFLLLVVKYEEDKIAIANYDPLLELAKFYNYEGFN